MCCCIFMGQSRESAPTGTMIKNSLAVSGGQVVVNHTVSGVKGETVVTMECIGILYQVTCIYEAFQSTKGRISENVVAA